MTEAGTSAFPKQGATGRDSPGSGYLVGIARARRSAAMALIVTWFGVPLALLQAAFLLVGGAVLGAFQGSSLLAGLPFVGEYLDLPFAQVGGIGGALLGAATGAILGFVAGLLSPFFATEGDPLGGLLYLSGQLFVGMLVGLIYTVYAVTFERKRFLISGARRPSRREAALLMPILAESAQRLGMRQEPPALLMDDARDPNAYAGARHIVINVGLLEAFNYDPEPIAAVICHELVHWRNADAVARYFVRGVALPLYLLYSLVAALGRAFAHPVVRVVLALLAWPVLVCVRYLIVPVEAADSRTQEYVADQGAVVAGHRAGLRRVLAEFHRSFDGARSGWDASVCASHPPNELRLEQTEEPGRMYPLPDENAPPRPLPVTVTSGLQRD